MLSMIREAKAEGREGTPLPYKRIAKKLRRTLDDVWEMARIIEFHSTLPPPVVTYENGIKIIKCPPVNLRDRKILRKSAADK